MKRILLTAAIAGASLAAATTAFAGEGYITANVSLRAGPDAGYPAVMGLRVGTPVMIEGCVDGWSWCDVSVGEDRGWVSGAYLQEDYDGRRVLVRDYGVRIGIPVVSFVFGDYWDHHYRGRSWYSNRDRYSHVQPHYYHSNSYGHSGSSYSHTGGSYSHGTNYQDTHHETHPTYSTGTHSGSVATHSVTTQPSYQAQHTQSTSHSAPSHTNTTPRHEVTSTSHASGSTSHVQQGHVSQSAPVVHGTPQRSASGEQHSAAGQSHAAEAHADKGAHGHDSNNGGGHKDKDNKDGGKGGN